MLLRDGNWVMNKIDILLFVLFFIVNCSKAFSDNLESAIERKEYDMVISLINKGLNPNTILRNGDTLLMRAIKDDAAEVIEVLIKNNVDMNLISLSGNHPLNTALFISADDIVFLIINQNIDWSYVDKKGFTFFENALLHRRINVLRYMLGYDEAVNSVIHKKGLSVKFMDYWCDGMGDIVDYFISRGFVLEINYQLISSAIFKNKYDAVKWLFDHGVSPYDTNDPDETALDLAMDRRHGLHVLEGTEEDVRESERIIQLIKERMGQEAGIRKQ
jgi:ankyrin repeat protein